MRDVLLGHCQKIDLVVGERNGVSMGARRARDIERRVLDAIAQDIDASPAVLQPVDAALVERVRVLVADIEVDCGQPLPPEIDDIGTL